MREIMTIAQIARQYNRDRSTVLRWVEGNRFPNAVKRETPAGEFWEIPSRDLKGFEMPKRGPKKKK